MPRLASLSALIVAAALAAGPAQAAGTIGLVLGGWRFALHETPGGKEECPDGFLHDQSANYKAEYPTPEARKAREEKFGYYTNRGPNGENVFYFPTSIKDPLPFREVRGTTGLGLNLDGESEGKGRGASLPHGNFTSPTGEAGIDNQLYRVLGCTPGWRKGGGIDGPSQRYILSELQNRLLLEITGVDDEANDPEVTVFVYRGLDPVATDSQGRLLPWLSQRIDYVAGRRFITRLKGRIDDGVLTTEPAPLRMSFIERQLKFSERRFKEARLRLKLNPTGAEGLLGGYTDIHYWYMTYAKVWGAHKVADIEGWSGPATYDALTRYADYRDPKTGKPAISTAYSVSFTRAFIVHDPAQEGQMAEVFGPAAAPGRLASR